MRTRLLPALLLAIASATLSARQAGADEDDDARSAMLRGTAAFGKGDAEAALAEYRRAIAFAPKANLPHRYAAEALVQLGRFEEAFAEFDAYLALNPGVSDANEVHARVSHLRAKHLPAHARVTATEADAVVRVDDALTPIALPAVLVLTPGSHILAVDRPGFGVNRRELRVVGDETVDLTFTLLPLPVVPPARPETRRETAYAPRESSWMRPAGTASMIAGAAVVATTFVLDVTVLRSKLDELDTASKRGAPDLQALKDDASRWQSGLGITYIAGGVVVLTGAAFYLLAPNAKHAVSVHPLPFGAKLEVRF